MWKCATAPSASPYTRSRPDVIRSSRKATGFTKVEIEPTRVYTAEDARQLFSGEALDVDKISPEVDGKFMSAFVRATKPAAWCGPSCCS